MDGSVMSSNDSGVVDPNSYHQQPQMQFYPQPQYQVPSQVPLFYTPTPMPQTPQIAQIAPIYPVPQQVQSNHSQQAPATVAVTQTTSAEQMTSTKQDEAGAENVKSAS